MTTDSYVVRPYHCRTWPFPFADVRGCALDNIDLSINKIVRLNERGWQVQVRGDALNFMNHPSFGLPQMDQFNSAFGQVTAQQNYARQVQLMFRMSF